MKDQYVRNLILIGVLIIVMAIVYPFVINHFFKDWNKSGTYGDTYGALNAIFSGLAFAGLITTIMIQKKELHYQRLELGLQRDEMKETRKEFLLNRTTNLVYNQLERFEQAIRELNIRDDGNIYRGNDAISYFRSLYKDNWSDPNKTDDENNLKRKGEIIKPLKVCLSNKSDIENFAHNIYNSVRVLQNLIFRSSLDTEDLNNLKNLFFENIGFVNMTVIEDMSKLSSDQLKLIKGKDYFKYNLPKEFMAHGDIFFTPVIQFYRLKLTNENFEKLKDEWVKENDGR